MAAALYDHVDATSSFVTFWKISYIHHM